MPLHRYSPGNALVMQRTKLTGGSSCCCFGCKKCRPRAYLPDTVTVTFSDLPVWIDANPWRTIWLDGCIGTGATGWIARPQPCDPCGPVTAVQVDSGGGGYARYGRVAPEITILLPNDNYSGEVTITFTQNDWEPYPEDKPQCKLLPLWTVTAATVNEPGSNYQDKSYITLEPVPGTRTHVYEPAALQIRTTRGTKKPNVTATIGPPGSGAVLEVTLASIPAETAGLEWEVTAVSVTNGGTGYAMDQAVTFTCDLATGVAAQAKAVVDRFEPKLTHPGSAKIDFSLITVPDTEPTLWSVDSVSLSGNGGNGYTLINGAGWMYPYIPLDINYGPDAHIVQAAAIKGRVGTIKPTVNVIDSNGSGATFNTTLEDNDAVGGGEAYGIYWTITNVTVVNGGSGYSPGDPLAVAASAPGAAATVFGGDWIVVGEVDENGSITAVNVLSGGYYAAETGALTEVTLEQSGQFFASKGIIQSITVTTPGRYYEDEGKLYSITIENAGKYYREDKNAEPITDVVKITAPMPNGYWSAENPASCETAQLSAIIQTDVNSAHFGEIIGVKIDSGGSCYGGTCFSGGHDHNSNGNTGETGGCSNECCGEYLNGREMVLVRGMSNDCYLRCENYLQQESIPWNERDTQIGLPAFIQATYNGPKRMATVAAVNLCNAYYSSSFPLIFKTAENAVPRCDNFEFTAYHAIGASVTVTEGGDPLTNDICFEVCRPPPPPPPTGPTGGGGSCNDEGVSNDAEPNPLP